MIKKLLLLPVLAFILNACSSSDVAPKKEFVGQWKANSFQLNFKLKDEAAENEVQDLSSENFLFTFMEDGTFTSSYVATGEEDFGLFPESAATYSVEGDLISLISKNELGQDETITYRYEINNDQLILSLDKELIRDVIENELKMEADALAAFGITIEEVLSEFFADVEMYDVKIIMVKAN